MRKNLLALLVVILFSMLFVMQGKCLADQKSMRYSISVAKFENRSSWSGRWNLGNAWGAVLTDSLNQAGRFIVLGEKDMRREGNFSKSQGNEQKSLDNIDALYYENNV